MNHMQADGKLLKSALACKLFPNAEDIAARITYAQRAPGHPAESRKLLEPCIGWTGVRDVIQRIVAEKTPTLVYGDYDVDGVTSSALMYRWLRSNDVPGNVFLPSRQLHGYGLSAEIISKAKAQGYGALLVLDCGTTSIDEIALARNDGLVCAVIDHHKPIDELPDCPILNHHLEDSLPAFCTAGLVYHVLTALRSDGEDHSVGDEVELAGLATLADVVPLTPENWQLAHHGLRAVPETINHGLEALIKSSKLHGLTRFTARQASFNLIPRLNAAGRVSSARVALDLVLATEPEFARSIASKLERLNDERKQMTDRVARDALLQASELQPEGGVVLHGSDWHIGVLGIVAARVAAQLQAPTIVLADDPTTTGCMTGSARSAREIDLMAALTTCRDILVSFGGHTKAAGVKLKSEQLAAFRKCWNDQTRAVVAISDVQLPNVPRFSITELDEYFERELWQLAPFGNGFPAPRCVLSGCRVERVNLMGRDKTHISIEVGDGERRVRIVGFNMSHLANRLTPGMRKDLHVELEPDNWNNRHTVMLRLLEPVDIDGGEENN